MLSFLTSLMERGGTVAIMALMFAENVFPPIPSEIIMPAAGYAAALGHMNLLVVIAAGSVGSIAGAVLWYYIGRAIGTERIKHFARRHGRWLTLTPQEIDRADRWFDRHGALAVFLGRLVPGVRTLISVPAGVAQMRKRTFFVCTAAGSIIWTAALAVAGYQLGENYDAVSSWLAPVSNVIVGGMVAYYLYRVATFRRHAPKKP